MRIYGPAKKDPFSCKPHAAAFDPPDAIPDGVRVGVRRYEDVRTPEGAEFSAVRDVFVIDLDLAEAHKLVHAMYEAVVEGMIKRAAPGSLVTQDPGVTAAAERLVRRGIVAPAEASASPHAEGRVTRGYVWKGERRSL